MVVATTMGDIEKYDHNGGNVLNGWMTKRL
jgi:hypothetical protein